MKGNALRLEKDWRKDAFGGVGMDCEGVVDIQAQRF